MSRFSTPATLWDEIRPAGSLGLVSSANSFIGLMIRDASDDSAESGVGTKVPDPKSCVAQLEVKTSEHWTVDDQR